MRLLPFALLLCVPASTFAERDLSPPAGLAGLLTPAHEPVTAPECRQGLARQRHELRQAPAATAARIGDLSFRTGEDSPYECSQPLPVFEPDGTHQAVPLPTLESDYEVPAMEVMQEREDWLLLRLGDRTGWLQRPADFSYQPYPALLSGRLSYATPAWDGELCNADGGGCRHARRSSEPMLRLLTQVQRGDDTWMEVELLNDTCRGDDETVLDHGWMRAWSENDLPAAWFYSRGC